MRASLFKRGGIYHAKFKLDAWPTERRESLGTTDKRVAQLELEKRLQNHERVAAGLLAPASMRDAAKRPLAALCDDFLADMEARDKAAGTVKKYRAAFRAVCKETGWTMLAQVTEGAVRAWVKESPLRAKTRNDYLAAWRRLFWWLKRQRLVVENVCEFVDPVDTRKTAREYRRALTEDEALRLLRTAPHPRCVLYRLILETGLRPLELRRLRVGDFRFGGWGGAPVEEGEGPTKPPEAAKACERGGLPLVDMGLPQSFDAQSAPPAAKVGPCVRVPGSITKNGKPALLPISAELAADLRALIPGDAAPFRPAFVKQVPKCPAFRRDLLAAGISATDDMGRRVDMHALRKTFGTHLVLSGAEPRVVMEAMRQSDLKLTMKTYMDAAQLRGPVLAAVALLPWHKMEREPVRISLTNTGTVV